MVRGWKGIALLGVPWRWRCLPARCSMPCIGRPSRAAFPACTFAPLTPAAAARTPLLGRGGAQVFAVTDDSPADKASIKPDEVVAAIDGTTHHVGPPGRRP